jgi:hypothetical protein
MSLEMAHKVILPPKKNYIPQFLKQRDINSYSAQINLLGQSNWCMNFFSMARYQTSLAEKVNIYRSCRITAPVKTLNFL